MKFVVATMVLIIGAGLAQAQQLRWTPSLRNPYTAPATFVGIDASVGYSMHSASLPYLDEI
ncbi:MAG: hypothetical protein ACK45E_05845, partial [Ignavibacteria bacterium]